MEIQVQLWVPDTAAATRFYASAFGASVVHRVGDDDDPDGVVQLTVGESSFWVSATSEAMRRFDAAALGGGTGRLLLVVPEPETVVAVAVAAGARLTAAVAEEHGWLVGRLLDPFGHEWEIARPLGSWPPAGEGSVAAER